MLATRSDLVALLGNGAESPGFEHGWRAELLGDGIARLLDGTRRTDVRRREGGLRLIDARAERRAARRRCQDG